MSEQLGGEELRGARGKGDERGRRTSKGVSLASLAISLRASRDTAGT